jgi:hypothetical protein
MMGLLLSTFAALAANMWGVSSCRFLFLDFQSDRGDFADMFFDPTPDGEPVLFRVGAGLFTWLAPSNKLDWSTGTCSGYNVVQIDNISDQKFEIARALAVFSVIIGVGVSLWCLFLACLSLTRCQIILLASCFFMLVGMTIGTHVIFFSQLCTQALVAEQSDDYSVQCTLDQGGLVVIASSILWCVSFLITVIYIKPPEADLAVINGQIENVFDVRMEQRKRLQREKQLQKLAMADQPVVAANRMKRPEPLDTGLSQQQQHQARLRQQAELHMSRTGSMSSPGASPHNSSGSGSPKTTTKSPKSRNKVRVVASPPAAAAAVSSPPPPPIQTQMSEEDDGTVELSVGAPKRRYF